MLIVSNENLKWVSLAVLVIQNSLLVLTMRYSRTVEGPMYMSSTAVVCSELTKFFLSLMLHVVQRIKEIEPPNHYSFKMLYNELFGKESDCIKIMVPAVLYLIQNNLQYLAATKLDAATFQVTYQMKILTTAIFSVIILRRTLYKHQWISLVLLTAGIALVQLPTSSAPKSDDSLADSYLFDKIVGISAVTIACILSGLAGVYFEKILKKSKVTVWARNVQLSLFSVIPGFFIGVMLLDGETYREHGFFYAYNGRTIAAIACQAVGGIIVALVVKYADNILKGFATSLSIIISCVASIWIFDFKITLIFIVGCTLVIVATFLYGKQVKKPEAQAEYKRIETSDEEDYNLEGLRKDENN